MNYWDDLVALIELIGSASWFLQGLSWLFLDDLELSKRYSSSPVVKVVEAQLLTEMNPTVGCLVWGFSWVHGWTWKLISLDTILRMCPVLFSFLSLYVIGIFFVLLVYSRIYHNLHMYLLCVIYTYLLFVIYILCTAGIHWISCGYKRVQKQRTFAVFFCCWTNATVPSDGFKDFLFPEKWSNPSIA